MGHWLHGMARRTEEIELNQAAAAPNFVATTSPGCSARADATDSSNPFPAGGEATRQGQNTGPVGWKSPTRQRWRSNGFSLGGTEGSNPPSSSGESGANQTSGPINIGGANAPLPYVP